MPEPESIFSPQPFPETNWSLIHQCQDSDPENLRASLDILFRKYWSPVYFYIIRYWTRDPEQAKDLTQAFFMAFLIAMVSSQKKTGRKRDEMLHTNGGGVVFIAFPGDTHAGVLGITRADTSGTAGNTVSTPLGAG